MIKPKDLADHFSKLLGKQVTVTPTQNRRVYLSWRPTRLGLEVRLHESLLSGDANILTAIRWLLQEKHEREARQRLTEFLASRITPVSRPAVPAPSAETQPKGQTYDLQEIMDSLNGEYFGGKCSAHIRWSPRQTLPHGARVRLGSYDFSTQTISLSVFLDHPEVPRHVVEHTVYHEMLHAVMGVDRRHGKRFVHTPEFRQEERRYAHHDECMAWLEHSFRTYLERRRRRPLRRVSGDITEG